MRFSCFLPSSLHGFVADRYTWELMKNTTFLVLLLLTVVSGCSSVLRNSASFYRDHPPSTHINWHEYTELDLLVILRRFLGNLIGGSKSFVPNRHDMLDLGTSRSIIYCSVPSLRSSHDKRASLSWASRHFGICR